MNKVVAGTVPLIDLLMPLHMFMLYVVWWQLVQLSVYRCFEEHQWSNQW